MTDEEIKAACEKFIADLKAKGATKLYMAFAYFGPVTISHTTFLEGINAIELLGISNLFVKRAMRDIDQQSGINSNELLAT